MLRRAQAALPPTTPQRPRPSLRLWRPAAAREGSTSSTDGEENQSFSALTCQHGGPHPVSIVVDGEGRTVHVPPLGVDDGAKEDPAAATSSGLLAQARPARQPVYRLSIGACGGVPVQEKRRALIPYRGRPEPL